MAVRVKAFAKINLGLRVLARRPDGYHEVRTTLQSVALADTITCISAPGPFGIECDDPGCPVDERNIVWRAAEALWRVGGRRGAPRDTRVQIRKRIPMEAGLGGGSSDAAASLRALAALWRVRVGARAVGDIAAGLGADVPFFLGGGTALGLGRGDLLFTLADAPPAWVVLVVPPVGVGTKDAYGWWDAANQPGPGRAVPDRAAGGADPRTPPAIPDGEWTNDFQPVVASRIPAIGRFVGTLRRAGAWHAGLSGSGSAVFGLFATADGAERGARRLSATGEPCFVAVTRTIGRAGYRARAAVKPWPPAG